MEKAITIKEIKNNFKNAKTSEEKKKWTDALGSILSYKDSCERNFKKIIKLNTNIKIKETDNFTVTGF